MTGTTTTTDALPGRTPDNPARPARVLVVGGPALADVPGASIQQVDAIPASALDLARLCLQSGAALWVLDERCFHHKKPQQLKFLAEPDRPAPWVLGCERASHLNVAPLIDAHASGVVEWGGLAAQLPRALSAVGSGRLWFPRLTLEAMYLNLMRSQQLRQPVAAAEKDLTPRELAVLACLRRGLTNKAIAAQLGVSVNTVKKQVASVMAKRSISRRRQLKV